MGNTVASEGEDMADSPRVAPGEISKSKRKHRSFRKRLADKFKRTSKQPKLSATEKPLSPKMYKEDKEDEEQPAQSSPKDQDKRRKYYKHLGIAQKGSREQEQALREVTRMTSLANWGNTDNDPLKDERDLTLNKTISVPTLRSLNNPESNYVDKKTKNGEVESDISPFSNDFTGVLDKTGAKNSAAETKADDFDLDEEMKTKESTSVTEEVEATFKNNDSEGFQLDFIKKTSVKSDAEMRRKFLSKLTQEKIWLTPSEKPKTHQTCIIFDWDDTLLCTTFLNPSNWGNFDLPLNVKVQLKKLEKAAFSILTEWLKYGEVYIITNAAEGWVEYSTQKYMQKLAKILDKVTVMSARAWCEAEFPDDVHQWKMKAFLKTQEKMEKGAVTNLVALGDSQFEMDAVKHLGTQFPRALIKTVKFRETPTPDELVKQINLVMMKLDQIWTSAKNLTIRLERK